MSDRQGKKVIVDGQQRLTTITLLLIYLRHHLDDEDQKSAIAEMIYSQKYGKKSLNLDITDRVECINRLLHHGQYRPPDDAPESIINLTDRYSDIVEHFPDALRGKALPYFADWLMENVYLVEITAYSDDDAYTIFETMNDRGLSLSPTDMLKGYLLSNISSPDERGRVEKIWQGRIHSLRGLGKDEDADAIKAWLRAQYAETIRERRRDSKPQDFERIGTEFHRWIREHEGHLGLRSSQDFTRFVEVNFSYYTMWYARLREASQKRQPGLEAVYYNAEHNFTLQYPVLLAALRVDDDEVTALRKLRVVATYLDILLHRRIWNFRAIDYSTMQYRMFQLVKDIRGRDVGELVSILKQRLKTEPDFRDTSHFRLHGQNGPQVHRILARLTDYVETGSGQTSDYEKYARRGRHGYEIEHIWADEPVRHQDEFTHESEFREYRNRIGGLLLLPKSFNASYGNLHYSQKRRYYLSQNLLARSLHEQTYERNPGFLRFIQQTGLPFRPHPDFKKADLDARQELYLRLAEQIWSPDRLDQVAQV